MKQSEMQIKFVFFFNYSTFWIFFSVYTPDCFVSEDILFSEMRKNKMFYIYPKLIVDCLSTLLILFQFFIHKWKTV